MGAKSGLLAEISVLARRGKQVWPFVQWKNRLQLGGASLLMAATSGANTGVALLLGQLVDTIQKGAEREFSSSQLYWAAGGLLGLIATIYVARELLNIARRRLVEHSVSLLNRDMQLQLVGHALRGDVVSLSAEKVGSLHGKIMRSVDGLVRFVRLMFLDFLPAILTGLIALIAAIAKQPWLGMVMLGVVPLAVQLTLSQLKSQKGVRLKLMRDSEKLDGAVVEQLGGAEYIRVAHTYDQEMLRLTHYAEGRRKRELRHHFEMSLYGCAKALNEGFFHIVVLAVATYMAINQRISYGDILTFSVLFINVMTPLSEVHRVMDEGHEASLRVGDLLKMLRKPLDRSFATPDSNNLMPRAGEPVIVAQDLVVKYRNASGCTKNALDCMSLAIRHGETIGVAGPSGSGKSTWVKVLLRLLHPDAGAVQFAGRPLSDVSRLEIARLVNYVGQNPFVFAGTIHDNIAYGSGQVTVEQVQQAARLANLHEEILQMSDKYQSLVTERGQNLSGGQRQRLAIARLMLRQAPILILDEATSALDNISERAVQRALGIQTRDRTTIIIAHRLTTLKNCDRILVFSDGNIRETGTYHELLSMNGLFAELVHSAETSIEVSDVSPAELAPTV